MLRISLLVLAGVCLAIGTAQAVPAMMTHHNTRSAWQQIRVLQGTAEYDAITSDRLYDQSRDAHRTAGHAGQLIAIALLLFSAGWRPARTTRSTHSQSAPWVRATLIDGGLAWLLGALGFLDGSASAVLHALHSAAPILLFLPFAGLVHGSSVGLRSQGLELEGRLDPALFLGPLAPLLVPLSRWWKPAAAVHLMGRISPHTP